MNYRPEPKRVGEWGIEGGHEGEDGVRRRATVRLVHGRCWSAELCSTACPHSNLQTGELVTWLVHSCHHSHPNTLGGNMTEYYLHACWLLEGSRLQHPGPTLQHDLAWS
jgi:hypothetical protein